MTGIGETRSQCHPLDWDLAAANVLRLVRRDRSTGRWTFEALVTPGREEALELRLTELSRRAAAPGPQPRGHACGGFRLIPSPDEHQSAVRQTVSYIRRGDLFQANICLRLEADWTRRRT